jgi:mono/diheme cytochrome c family protein
MPRWMKVSLVAIALGVLGLGGLVVVAAGGVAAFVAYAVQTGESGLQYPDTPYPTVAASTDPELVERGRYLANGPSHCATCHSTGDREHPELIGTTPLTGGLAFEMGPIGARYAANLTPDPTTGIGRWTDAEVARTIRTGVLPDGELSVFMAGQANLSDEDLVAVLSYLRSLEPVSNAVPDGEWFALAKVMLTVGAFRLEPRLDPPPTYVPHAEEPSVARGEYVAEHLALCVGCHTTVDMATFEPVGPKAGGGTVEPSHGADSDMEYAPPNLTSDPTGVTGKLDEDAFVARLGAGRVHLSSIMPWENLGSMTEADQRSVYRYLKSLPPVANDTGPPYRRIGWTAEAPAGE